MKIVACIKQVPDTEAEVKWDIPGGKLKRDAMDSITNPLMSLPLKKPSSHGRIMMVKLSRLVWVRKKQWMF